MVVPSSGAPNPAKSEGVVKRQRHRPESSSMLDLWLQHHNNNLYPSKDEKEQLVKDTQLNYNQVSRWFANRRRKLKLRNCVSPSSSSGVTERHSSSPSESVPGISPQAPNCPGNATIWNDGFNTTGGIETSGVISSLTDQQQTILDANNNNSSDNIRNPIETVTSTNCSQLPLPHPTMTNQQTPPIQHLPPISESNLFGGAQTNQRQFFGAHDLLPTPPALIPGIYPTGVSGRFPFSVPPFGVSSGLNLGTSPGLLNPFFLSALASANAGLAPNHQNSPAANLWMNGGNAFLPSLFSHPLLNPPDSEKQKNDQR